MHGKNLHAHSHKFRQCKDTRNTSKIHANPLLAGDVPDGFLTNSTPCKNSNKHFNTKVRLFFLPILIILHCPSVCQDGTGS